MPMGHRAGSKATGGPLPAWSLTCVSGLMAGAPPREQCHTSPQGIQVRTQGHSVSPQQLQPRVARHQPCQRILSTAGHRAHQLLGDLWARRGGWLGGWGAGWGAEEQGGGLGGGLRAATGSPPWLGCGWHYEDTGFCPLSPRCGSRTAFRPRSKLCLEGGRARSSLPRRGGVGPAWPGCIPHLGALLGWRGAAPHTRDDAEIGGYSPIRRRDGGLSGRIPSPRVRPLPEAPGPPPTCPLVCPSAVLPGGQSGAAR